MLGESEPGTSAASGGQGYCGFCRVLYRNLDEHLSSLRHQDSVRASSRSSSSSGSVSSSRVTLLERFLQDVLLHHPHRYSDPRPTHADLPSVFLPLSPRPEVADVHLSDDDCKPQSIKDCSSSSDYASSKPPSHQEENRHNQSGSTQSQKTPPLQTRAPLRIYGKAHRKTDKRKNSDSSVCLQHLTTQRPHPTEQPHTTEQPHPSPEKERTAEIRDTVDQTIEEVIQLVCADVVSSQQQICGDLSGQQEETKSLHISVCTSQSEEWDTYVHVARNNGQGESHGKGLDRLLDLQVHLEDQVYSQQLDSALNSHHRTEEGTGPEKTDFLTLPIEDVLPTPENIPQSFRGKSWVEIEQEDEEKVEKMVQQFRRGAFVCYFDTDSLARYGRRTQSKKLCEKNKEEEAPADLLLLDCNESECRQRRSRRRSVRVASRCQVVKVSRSTQTLRFLLPAVRQAAPKTPPMTDPPATIQNTVETTPRPQRQHIPPFLPSIVSPVQPHTSVIYLLGSPSGPAPEPSAGCMSSRRCKRKRRPLHLQGSRVKYKPLPVSFYDLSTARILSHAPKKNFIWKPRHPTVSIGQSPSCIRQLFRSLSPELNADRAQGEGPSDAQGVDAKTRTSSDIGKKLVRGRSRVDKARGAKKERTHALLSKRRTRTQTTPLLSRREGLRRGTSVCNELRHPPPRLRRSRRGQS